MNTKVADLMVASVVTTHAHKSIGHVKDIMNRNGIHSLPIVDSENELEGIVTVNDLTSDELSDDTLVGHIMTRKVYTVPLYADTHIAARVMRNHHIHHLVVTHEKKIVGVLSSFDLLLLVENHRYVAKNPPTPSKKKAKRV